MTDVPILVGAATAEQWPDHPGDGVSCGELMADAARAAIEDTGAAGLGSTTDLVLVTRGLSNLSDGAHRIAAALGAPRARCVAYQAGIPQQALISRAIDAVRRGEARTVVVAGGETKRRDDLARRAGIALEAPEPWSDDELIVPEGEIVARPEVETRAVAPVQQYALIDSARRAANGWSLDEHRDDIADIWESFNEVARANPRAAFGRPMSAAEIREPTDENRLLAFPYNKWHNSQWAVDQAAALVITSESLAAEHRADPARWLYPHVALESSQSLSLSRRADLHRWPAMGVVGRAAAEHLGRPLASIEHVELYSCFPAAVRVQQAELDLDPVAPATITGGMAFAGGPFNNFVYQATVAMAERLRSDPGSLGLVTVVSGLLTKPGLTVWTTTRPESVLVADLVEEATAATVVAPLDEDPAGVGRIATYTVVDDRVVAVIDLEEGDRAVATLDDAAIAVRATREELIGAVVAVDGRSMVLR